MRNDTGAATPTHYVNINNLLAEHVPTVVEATNIRRALARPMTAREAVSIIHILVSAPKRRVEHSPLTLRNTLLRSLPEGYYAIPADALGLDGLNTEGAEVLLVQVRHDSGKFYIRRVMGEAKVDFGTVLEGLRIAQYLTCGENYAKAALTYAALTGRCSGCHRFGEFHKTHAKRFGL